MEKFLEATKSGIVCRIGIESVIFKTPLMANPSKIEQRRLEDLDGLFRDKEAYGKAEKQKLIYSIYYFDFAFNGLSCAVTEMLPGKIGEEYYFTKGHFHKPPEASETYIVLHGNGIVILQHEDNEKPILIAPFSRGMVVFTPPYYGHRVVNIGSGKLYWISIFNTGVELNYEKILKEGFKVSVVEKDGKATFIENIN